MTVRVLSKGRSAEGRTALADFGNTTAVAAQFTLTNLSYTTDANDSARPCLTPTVDATLATLVGRGDAGLAFRDSETTVRAWIPGSVNASNVFRVGARYLGATDYISGTKNYSTGQLAVSNRYAGSSDSTATFAQAAVTSGYWVAKFRVEGACRFLKFWLESGSEPDWQIINAIDVSSRHAVELGAPALTLQLMGAVLITDFVVTELL